ncbi:MAG: PKD domain-containing protein [Desulfobacterales bacterium]
MAYAGADQTVNENVRVTLRGSGVGSGLSYEWNQVEGISVKLSSDYTAQPTFTAPDLNTGNADLVFHLTVEDSRGYKDTDSVNVFVKLANGKPTARAGADQTVTPGSTVTLDGSGSTDPEGSIASYQWSSSGGVGSFPASLNGPTPSFTAPNTEGWVIYDINGYGQWSWSRQKIGYGYGKSDGFIFRDPSSGTPPASPSGLAANALSYRQIRLRWTDESDNEDGFIIYRRQGFCGAKNSNPYAEIARVPSTEGAEYLL